MENPKEVTEALLMERIIELIRSSPIVAPRIIRFMRKNNITTVIDFMNIKMPMFKFGQRIDQLGDGRKFVMMGPKTFLRIKEIQKIIAEENKKELKKVPVTTYEWRLV